jgi:hypothetical protein
VAFLAAGFLRAAVFLRVVAFLAAGFLRAAVFLRVVAFLAGIAITFLIVGIGPHSYYRGVVSYRRANP